MRVAVRLQDGLVRGRDPGCTEEVHMVAIGRYARGQIAIVLAVTLACVIGAMALSVDVMMFYWHWSLLEG